MKDEDVSDWVLEKLVKSREKNNSIIEEKLTVEIEIEETLIPESSQTKTAIWFKDVDLGVPFDQVENKRGLPVRIILESREYKKKEQVTKIFVCKVFYLDPRELPECLTVANDAYLFYGFTWKEVRKCINLVASDYSIPELIVISAECKNAEGKEIKVTSEIEENIQ